MYAVGSIFDDVEDAFEPLVMKLKAQCTSFPKMAGNIYLYFMDKLGDDATEPKDAPNLSMFRMVNVFTSVVEEEQREQIIKLHQGEPPPNRYSHSGVWNGR
jgi:hypothetical protein